MFKRVSMLLVVLVVAGCSTIPDKIQLPEGTQLTTYEAAASQAEKVKGQMARWGGVIAKIENKEDNTLLEVVYYPLKSYGRPVAGDESIGRFRVYVNGFLDPMVYKVGRTMTFTGEFTGLEDGLVGEHKYVFPTLKAKAYYLWKDIQQIDVTSVNVWPYDYWYGMYPRPYYPRAYIRSSGYNRTPAANTKPVVINTERSKQ